MACECNEHNLSKQTYQNDVRAIHPLQIAIAFKALPRASVARVALAAAFGFYGPRLSEVAFFKVTPDALSQGRLRWYLGKNQKGVREEASDPRFEAELHDMRARHSYLYGQKGYEYMFAFKDGTFLTRLFHKVRKNIGGAWSAKKPDGFRNINGDEWLLHLSGIRKTAATLLFAKAYKEYGDYNIAAQKVQRRFRHSSPWMTTHHYIDDMKAIDALKYCDMTPWEILYELSEAGRQASIEEYLHEGAGTATI